MLRNNLRIKSSFFWVWKDINQLIKISAVLVVTSKMLEWKKSYTLVEKCAWCWRTYNDCLQFNGNGRFVIKKMWQRKVLIFLSTVFTCTDILYINFSEIQKISKCWASFCLFYESFFSVIFWLAFHGSFRFNIVSFWLNLLPFGLFLFFFLVWPLLSLVEHMNNLWVTIIKIACTIWLIMVTYERHEQSYLSQNGFRQFPVSSQNIWQLQYNYWTTR